MNAATADEKFRSFVNIDDLTDELVYIVLENNPRMLYDIFDKYDIYIQINVNPSNFSYSINQGEVVSGPWETRLDAEKEAIVQSFELLEAKL